MNPWGKDDAYISLIEGPPTPLHTSPLNLGRYASIEIRSERYSRALAIITRKSLDSWWYLLSRNSCILLKIK